MALKKIFDAFENVTDAQRTYREVAVLQQLNHPNIVNIYETMRSEDSRDLYLTMEYVDADLYQLIAYNVLKEAHKNLLYIKYPKL